MKNIYSQIIIFASVFLFNSCGSDNTQSFNEIPSPVQVSEVKPSPISHFINTSGNAVAMKEVVLKSQMSGNYILGINPATGKKFRLGDKVRAGQTIVRFEDQEYLNSLSLETKKLSYTIAENDLVKQKALYEKGGVKMSDIRNSEVSVLNAKTDYENSLLKYEYMSVKAPFDGVIVDLPHFTEYTKVDQGASIVSVMDYSKLYMDINLPESAIPYVKPNQNVMITHYTIPYDTIVGYINEISPAINQETRTFKGKMIIDNYDLKLRPGMFVKADIQVDFNKDVIVIPKNIIMTSGGKKKFIYVLDKNVAKYCEIKTGIEDRSEVQIVEGLNIGDIIITKGFETLRDECKVKVER